MFGKNVPHRGALLLIDGGPSRHLVAPGGIEAAAIIELKVGNPPPRTFRGRTSIGKTADPDHVAALLMIGIGIEKIVADVFEDILDLAAGHVLYVGFRVADG